MSLPSGPIVIGYHGCDEEIGRELISGARPIAAEDRPYHWLGSGIYFWENDYDRALEWAKEKAKRNEIQTPFVVGGAIRLGNCLDLYIKSYRELLVVSYKQVVAEMAALGVKVPKNLPAKHDKRGDNVRRFLDCAVINNLHITNTEREWDTVRGLFIEGDEIYPGAGIRDKTHSEIAVRNTQCIIGLFLPPTPPATP